MCNVYKINSILETFLCMSIILICLSKKPFKFMINTAISIVFQAAFMVCLLQVSDKNAFE
jgi:hypothetical protein